MLLASVKLGFEQDVVLARQRARQTAQLLGYDAQDQVRIATAVSEIAREGLLRNSLAEIEFHIEIDSSLCLVKLRCDQASRRKDFRGGDLRMIEGIVAARKILWHFEVEESENSTVWVFGRSLPREVQKNDPAFLKSLAEIVVRAPPRDVYQEFQAQNQELLDTLGELRRHQAELAKVNRELEETNRGVVALYAELDEKAESIRQAAEQKNRFYSSISHEFRTPVTSILSLSRFLLERLDGELTCEQERQVKLIHNCGQNLLEWVNDLLDLARVDAGRMQLRVSTFSVHDLLASLRGMMRPLAVRSEVALNFNEFPAAARCEMHTDEGKVAQILRNFVSNALKFTEQGEVRLSAAPLAENDDLIAFTVKDTGIGIAPRDQERIFEEFVQIDSPSQQKTKGTGLGLPLSKRLAELLGGAIRVQSCEGEGAEFTLTVPRRILVAETTSTSQVDSSPPAPGPGPETRQSARPTALLIDDDPAWRYLLMQTLRRLSVEVVEASRALHGLELARTLKLGVVFLDLALPEMNGFEAIEALKSSTLTRGIPVVIYSAQELTDDELARLRPLALEIIKKPLGSEGPSALQIADLLQKAGVATAASPGAVP